MEEGIPAPNGPKNLKETRRALQTEIDALQARLKTATGKERHEIELALEKKDQARQEADRIEFFPS